MKDDMTVAEFQEILAKLSDETVRRLLDALTDHALHGGTIEEVARRHGLTH